MFSNMTLINSSSTLVSIFIGIFLSLIAFLTALGNIVVLLAFYCDKKLRTINDYFILNMAIADFLVGFICIPFYIPFSLTQIWPFGRLFCKIWVTIDDVSTMASVINIVAISINRYWSIAYPISYRKYVRQHFVYLVMIAIWLISFLNFAPGIWLLSLFERYSDVEMNITRSDCSGDYNKSFVYMLFAQFNYFIWPFIVLFILNLLLMINIWKRSRKMIRLKSIQSNSKVKSGDDDDKYLRMNSNDRCPSIIPEENENENDNIPISLTTRSSTYSQKIMIHKKRESNAMISYSRRSTSVHYSLSPTNRSESLIEYHMDSELESSRPILNEINSRKQQQQPQIKSQAKPICPGQTRILRDRKAARSLFILVIVFLLFLFPYVICATATTAGANISSFVFEISFWLLWLNSTCNPFLYPFIQIKYRKAYFKLFQSIQQFFSFSSSNSRFH